MKKLTIDAATALMIDIIAKDKRHRDYKRTVEMSEKMLKLISGEDMGDLMRKFNRRESDEQFEQRVDITQHITGTVAKNLMKPEYKIPRSNGVRRTLAYANDNENSQLHELEGILNKFWGNKSLDKYLNKRWIDLTNIDPNSFIVFEWGEFDNNVERAKPYPFEVSSDEAIYYNYINNVLQFLVVLNEFEEGAGNLKQEVDEKDTMKNVTKRYTMYLEGYSIVFDQIDDKKLIQPFAVKTVDNWTVEDGLIDIKGRIYKVSIISSGLDFIPVMRVGFDYDPMTRGRTCLPPIWDAVPILMKIIKANSEMDLTMALHAHPQKLQYVRQCQEENCNQGRTVTGTKCTACKGTGREKVATTAQEVIELIMPRDKEDIVPLDQIVLYVAPSVELVKFQDDYIRALTELCIEAVYNSQVFSRKQIAETATKSGIDRENVYDSLYPMAEAFADAWEFSIHAISRITDKDEGLVYSYVFSKDFKMKTISELIMDLKTASDSKADPFVKESIQNDIALIVYTDNPTELSKHNTMRRFYPYSGKSPEQIALVLATKPATDFNRVLWEIYGSVFNEIELEQTKKGVNYYDLTVSKQWSILSRHVKNYIKTIEENPMPTVEVVDKEDEDKL